MHVRCQEKVRGWRVPPLRQLFEREHVQQDGLGELCQRSRPGLLGIVRALSRCHWWPLRMPHNTLDTALAIRHILAVAVDSSSSHQEQPHHRRIRPGRQLALPDLGRRIWWEWGALGGAGWLVWGDSNQECQWWGGGGEQPGAAEKWTLPWILGV